ncbi:MAG: hypothetical protein K2L90_03080, partial [Muribaculaceae bacterium]|nr:hypothetical protein [Muribaculaceae bacterium]
MTFTACSGDDPIVDDGSGSGTEQPDPKPDDPGTETPDDPVPGYAVGQTLPAWSEGHLDIHYISSGRGECAFYILPDGTTMLVDAGETAPTDETGAPAKPDGATRPYVVDGRYIQHFLPAGHSAIDWCAPSHFHVDHIGNPKTATETSPEGYRISGLTGVYGMVPFNRILDRGYPDYKDDPDLPTLEGAFINDWVTFVKWAVGTKGVEADRFRAGEEQITLLYDKEKYPEFRIFNVVANGFAWNLNASTGKGRLVDAKAGSANAASCGFHLTYGKFDYIACGDLTSAPQNRMAFYYRDFIPKGGLEVFKANHHLSSGSWGSQMQNCEFTPQVVVCQSFFKKQPDIQLLTWIVDGTFTTHPY